LKKGKFEQAFAQGSYQDVTGAYRLVKKKAVKNGG
jgi:hypothetical protein